MSTRNYKVLTLTRAGGGKLRIHPDEWAALQQAVTNALQLDADPAVSYEDLPQGTQRVDSPLGNGRVLVADFERVPLDRPLEDYYRETFREQ